MVSSDSSCNCSRDNSGNSVVNICNCSSDLLRIVVRIVVRMNVRIVNSSGKYWCYDNRVMNSNDSRIVE